MRKKALIYTIGLLSEEERHEANRAKRALLTLAEATGGQAYFCKDLSEVTKIAHQVAHDIRSQYVITYSPTNQTLDGSFHQIKVVANGPTSLLCARGRGITQPPQPHPEARRHLGDR